MMIRVWQVPPLQNPEQHSVSAVHAVSFTRQQEGVHSGPVQPHVPVTQSSAMLQPPPTELRQLPAVVGAVRRQEPDRQSAPVMHAVGQLPGPQVPWLQNPLMRRCWASGGTGRILCP